MPEEPPAGSALRDGVEWRSSTQRSGPNLHLAVATGAGLRIGVGASEDLLPSDQPAAVAVAIADALIALADGSTGTLTDLVPPPARDP